jgi:hypothetical protein
MGNNASHQLLPAPSAWTDSQLDVCLDRLGTCESTVRDQEVEIDLLQLALKALAHPWAIVGMAITIAILGLVEVCRQLWHICHGNLEGAFPLDRVLGWFLRRLWRVFRYPFVLLAARVFRRRAAEEVRDRLDQQAVSPVQADPPPPYAVQEGPQRAVPLFRSFTPRPAVVGRDLEDADADSSLSTSAPPPPPPPSATTVYHTAREVPMERRTAAEIRSSAASLALLRRLLDEDSAGKSLDGQATRAAPLPPPSSSSSSAPATVLTVHQVEELSRWSAHQDVSTENFTSLKVVFVPLLE